MKKRFRIFYLTDNKNGANLLALPTASGEILFSFSSEEKALNHFKTYYDNMHNYEITILPVYEFEKK